MATRTALLDATRRASEILRDVNAQRRISEGYTRIDPVRIAESVGVTVMLQRLDKLLGAYINEGRPGVLVNVDRPAGLVHMTCAHELGHFFLRHRPTADLNIDYGDTASSTEQEADQFAYSLLAPQWLIARVMQRKGWTIAALSNAGVVYQLSLRLGTSFTSTVWTLARMKWLSYDAAQRMVKIQPKKLKLDLAEQGAASKRNTDVWLLDESDRDVILEPHKNDLFVFQLKSNLGAGYMWSLDEIQSEGFSVEPVRNDITADPAKRHFGSDPAVGGDGSLRFIVSRPENKHVAFDARTSFAMVEHRPWLPPAQDDNRYQFAAEYERLDSGVNRAEQQLRLEEAKALNA